MTGGTILYWIIGLAIVGAVAGMIMACCKAASDEDDASDDFAHHLANDPRLIDAQRVVGPADYAIAVPNAGGRGTQDGASRLGRGALWLSHDRGL